MLVFCMLFVGCAGLIESVTEPENGPGESPEDIFRYSVADFSLALLRYSAEENAGNNLLLAPASAASVLSVAELGSEGETRAELAAILERAMPSEEYRQELSECLRSDNNGTLQSAQMLLVNSNGQSALNDTFVRESKAAFDMELRLMPFGEETRSSVNRWASKETNGKIAELMDAIDPGVQVYLLDACSLEEAWTDPYAEDQVISDAVFTAASGTKRHVTMLSGAQEYYFTPGDGTGFTKSMGDGRHTFFSILPPEGVSVESYLSELTGEELIDAFHELRNDKIVYTQIPEFCFGYDTSLCDSLRYIGAGRAFSDDAEFVNILVGRRLQISAFFQKTFIALDRSGVSASAGTVMAMGDIAGAAESREVVSIVLDRPFVFGIVDTDSGVPLFLGVLNDPEVS